MTYATTLSDKARALPDYHFPDRNSRNRLLDATKAVEDTQMKDIGLIEDIVPVPLGLRRFYNELKHKQPTMTFIMGGSPRFKVRLTDADSCYVFGHIGIAYTDAPDILVGKIRLDINANNEPVYCVESPEIRNDRFASYNDEYHIKRTKKFKDAVKTATTYLKPKDTKSVLEDTRHVFESAQSQIKSPAAHKLYEACAIQHHIVQQEIEAMLAFGYTPKTPQFIKAFELMRDEGEELKQVAKYKPKASFVWLKSDRAHIIAHDGVETVAHTMDDVPEDIRNKIAVLQIGADNSAIINVGVKVDNTKYWVFE